MKSLIPLSPHATSINVIKKRKAISTHTYIQKYFHKSLFSTVCVCVRCFVYIYCIVKSKPFTRPIYIYTYVYVYALLVYRKYGKFSIADVRAVRA